MNTKLPVEAHLTEEVLIRFLDGELAKRGSEAAARHLDACWTCRSRREQLRQAMDRFVQLEEALVEASAITPTTSWAGIRERLNVTGAQAPSLRPPMPRRFMQAVGMVGVAVAVAVWFMPPTSVSAMELLERSAASEQPLLKGKSNPLVLQRLRVESAHRAASLSLWNAPQARKFHEKWESHGEDLRADLNKIYEANGLDLQHPLSAANHAHWRRSLKEHEDSVLQQGELLGVVTRSSAAVRPGEITEAELWVRRSDWHSVRESFRVAAEGGTEEYRIVETAFHVETLDADNARVFDSAPPASETTAVRIHSIGPALESADGSAVASAPTQIDLIETEIEALALLHEMDADRQDSAEVKRTGDHVEVAAYTPSEDRKLELESHLAAMPLVISAVHLLSESPAAQAFSEPASSAAAPSSASEPPLFLKPLVQQTGSLDIANRIVSDQMDLLRHLCIELGAVKSLEQRFPSEVRQLLPPRSLSRLDALALDHLDAARHYWLELERNASPLLSAMRTSAGEPANVAASCGAWYRLQERPVDAAERLEDLYTRAFTTSAGAPSDVSQESIVVELPQLRSKLAAELAEGCVR
jgi:hypothetical protein